MNWKDKYLNKIICGNNVDVLSYFPDNVIDLTVTSPPYGDLRDYKGFEFDFESIAKQLFRVTSDGGVVVWVVGDRVIDGSESGESFRQALYFKEIGFKLWDTMIYLKNMCRYPETVRYYQLFEYMFVLTKGNPKTVNLISDRVNISVGNKTARASQNRQKDGGLAPNSSYKNNPDREVQKFGIRGNVWRYSVGKGNSSSDDIAFEHPAIFPELLARDHIISWSNPNDIVLDPFCGSGTTCKMAKAVQRNFIGIDISEEYCEISRKRISMVQSEFLI